MAIYGVVVSMFDVRIPLVAEKFHNVYNYFFLDRG